jgi:hypothetical protein
VPNDDLPYPVRFRTQIDGQEVIIVQMIAASRTETSAGGFGSAIGIGARYKTVTEVTYDNAVLTTMKQAGTVEEARMRVAAITGRPLDTIVVLNPPTAGDAQPLAGSVSCPGCGHLMAFGANYCANCGAPTTKAAEPPSQPGAEHADETDSNRVIRNA